MIFAILGLLTVAIVVAAWVGAPHVERALLYHPFGGRVAPEDVDLNGVSEVLVPTPDGEKIVAWHAAAAPGRKTVLYFHGNGASLAARSERVRAFMERGFGIFIMSYRGYSGSTGTPSERVNVMDAHRAYEMLISKGVFPTGIVLYGESLGSGVAVQVAASKPVSGVVLDAPYTSIVDVATLCYPYLPARLVMRDRYETMEHLAQVSVPILIIHGESDNVIPVSMGRTVASKAPGPVKLVTFPGAGHTDHHEYGSMDVVRDWIAELA